jgi:hypothetical protein
MKPACFIDGETLSRFRDGELAFEEYRSTEAHVAGCRECESRLRRYGLADAVMSRAALTGATAARPGRLTVSLAAAAALVASLAANTFLTPRAPAVQPVSLRLSMAPAETLSSFYAKVAPPRGLP